MAFEQLEPFGSLHMESMLGQICATLANVHSDPDKSQALRPSDFMPQLRRAIDGYPQRSGEAVLIQDPVEMSRLIKQRIFKVKD